MLSIPAGGGFQTFSNFIPYYVETIQFDLRNFFSTWVGSTHQLRYLFLVKKKISGGQSSRPEMKKWLAWFGPGVWVNRTWTTSPKRAFQDWLSAWRKVFRGYIGIWMSWGKRLEPGGCVSGGLFLEDKYVYIYIWVASSYNMDLFGWWFFTFYRGKSTGKSAIWVRLCFGTFSVRTVSKQIQVKRDSFGEELLRMGFSTTRGDIP